MPPRPRTRTTAYLSAKYGVFRVSGASLRTPRLIQSAFRFSGWVAAASIQQVSTRWQQRTRQVAALRCAPKHDRHNRVVLSPAPLRRRSSPYVAPVQRTRLRPPAGTKLRASMRSLLVSLFVLSFVTLTACDGDQGESCDQEGVVDGECDDGLVCGKSKDGSKDLVCLKQCHTDADCPGGACNGVANTNLKGCQPRD